MTRPKHTMIRSKTLLAALALPFVIACTSPDAAEEPLNAQVDSDAETDTEELDPNDPNVMVCPVTGALQLKSDADGSTHGEMGEHGSVDHD